MEEENRQAQPQLYGTQYFSVRKTLTGLLLAKFLRIFVWAGEK